MKKLMIRALAVLLALTMLVSLAACKQFDVDEEDVTIVFCNYAVLETAHTEFWNKMIADFQTANPHIKVEVVSAAYNDVLTYAINRIGGGDTIDVMYGEIGWNQVLASNGVTSPITEVLDQKFIDEFDSNVLGCFNYNGELYGLPFLTSGLTLFINKRVVEAAGLDVNNPPKTQAELESWCEVLKEKCADDVVILGLPMAEKTAPGSFIKSMVYAFGGTITDANGKLAIDGNQGFNECIDFYKSCVDKGWTKVNQLPKDLRPMMATDKVALYVDQTWGFSGTYAVDNTAASYVMTAAMPAMGTNGKGYTGLSAHTFYVSNNGDKQAEASRKFIEFLLNNDEFYAHFAESTPGYYAYGPKANSNLHPILETSKEAANMIQTEVFFEKQDAYQISIAKMMNAICSGTASKEDAIANFKKEVAGYVNK